MKIDVTKNSEGNTIVRYNIDMPANTYFSFCYGKNMRNVDMVVWLAGSSGVVVQDLYSYGDYTPHVDSHQDYTTTNTDTSIRGSSRLNIICTRLLNTGDSYDFIIPTVL